MESFTEENYLKAIYKLTEKSSGKVSTSSIAELMGINPASVTDMLKKLAEREFINYEKSKGVALTEKGETIAVAIIRRHRLWEVFLVNVLHYKWDEVHDLAEQLEHIQPNNLVDRLDHFLGYPKFDPHGDPIPERDGKIARPNLKLLSELKLNQSCTVSGVADTSVAFLKYLDKLGIGLSDKLFITEHEPYDRSLTVVINDASTVIISENVAKNILVKYEQQL